MPKKTQLPEAPSRRFIDFELEGFTPPRYARVIYQPVESAADRKVVHAQAFEVDASGKLVAYSTGAPSRTAGTNHTISASGIGDTHTLTPGWVRVAPPSGVNWTSGSESMPANLPEGCEPVDELPGDPTPNQLVFMGDHVWRYCQGEVYRICEGKAEELAGILRNSDAMSELDL